MKLGDTHMVREVTQDHNTKTFLTNYETTTMHPKQIPNFCPSIIYHSCLGRKNHQKFPTMALCAFVVLCVCLSVVAPFLLRPFVRFLLCPTPFLARIEQLPVTRSTPQKSQ